MSTSEEKGLKEDNSPSQKKETTNVATVSTESEPVTTTNDTDEKNEAGGEGKAEETVTCNGDPLSFKMVWNKKNFDMVKLGKNNTVSELRKYIEELTGIPTDMQKIMFKGLVKDEEKTLEQLKIAGGSKVMVVGSTLKDVETIKTTTAKQVQLESRKEALANREPICKQKQHRKVLDKGKPDDLPPGVKGLKEPLPPYPISGMINKTGGRVRLTFKLELDQLWLGTKERTEKLPMSSIRSVISEAIEGSEEYHILAIQLGPTEASRYWIYWFPAQFVDAVKDTILGKWQSF